MKNPVIIGVAGGTGSGKTTVVEAIVKRLGGQGVVLVQHDSYYRDFGHLSPPEREGLNFDHPDALETELLVEHLGRLVAGEAVEVPSYDFRTHTRVESSQRISPAGTVIVEGILIFADKRLREMMDVKIFVDTDDDIRFIRRLKRDINERGRGADSVINQYLKTVRPMHMEFVEPSRRYADVIIPEGHNPVAVALIVSMIKGLIDVGRISPVIS